MSNVVNHRMILSLALAGLAAAAFVTSDASAQRVDTTAVRATNHYSKDLPPKLLKEAKVGEDSASRIAAARIPAGHIRGVELEREHGNLIYSYELKVPHRSGIEEVNVNAMDGTVVNVEHEGPKAERAESDSEHGETDH